MISILNCVEWEFDYRCEKNNFHIEHAAGKYGMESNNKYEMESSN